MRRFSWPGLLRVCQGRRSRIEVLDIEEGKRTCVVIRVGDVDDGEIEALWVSPTIDDHAAAGLLSAVGQ